MDSYTKTIIINSHQSQELSLASIARVALYTTFIVKPLQNAWKRKDKHALRQKYICCDCKKPIANDVNKYICRFCKYVQMYLVNKSQQLDGYFF